MLEVIDVSNLKVFVFKDCYIFLGNRLEFMKVVGNYVIVVCGWEGIRFFDVSDLMEILFVGYFMNINQNVCDLFIDKKGYVYVVNDWGGLKIFDVSDFRDLIFVGGLVVSLDFEVRSIDVWGNYVYLVG